MQFALFNTQVLMNVNIDIYNFNVFGQHVDVGLY